MINCLIVGKDLVDIIDEKIFHQLSMNELKNTIFAILSQLKLMNDLMQI